MKNVKYHLGFSKVYPVDIDDFRKTTKEKYPYKHYVLEVRRKDITDEDREVLQIAEDNFDRCIYLIRKSTGLAISNSFAKQIAIDYINKYGYMTYDRTKENIPWIMLSCMTPFSVWKRLIIKDSPLYVLLKRNNVKFEKTDNESTVRVSKDLHFTVVPSKYRFNVDADTNLSEYITLYLTVPDGEGTYKEVDSIKVELPPYHLTNMVNSTKETHRNRGLLEIASNYLIVK